MSPAKSVKSVLVVLVYAAVVILAQAAHADLITGVTASASSALLSVENTVNNSGLTGDMHINFGPGSMWLSELNEEADGWIEFDLGAVYALGKMHVWNYNGFLLTGAGMKNVVIKLSTNGSDWTSLPPTFAQASGSNDYTGFDVPLNSTSARYVKIESNSNHASGFLSSTAIGLSEVQFHSLPEPATMVLLALGGGWAIIRRRKHC